MDEPEGLARTTTQLATTVVAAALLATGLLGFVPVSRRVSTTSRWPAPERARACSG